MDKNPNYNRGLELSWDHKSRIMEALGLDEVAFNEKVLTSDKESFRFLFTGETLYRVYGTPEYIVREEMLDKMKTPTKQITIEVPDFFGNIRSVTFVINWETGNMILYF